MNPWKLKLVRRPPETLAAQPVITNPEEIEPGAPPPPTTTSWSDDRQLSLFVLLGLTAIAGYLTYIIFRPFLTALVVAIVMAIAFTPPHKWIVRKVRNRRPCSAADNRFRDAACPRPLPSCQRPVGS